MAASIYPVPTRLRKPLPIVEKCIIRRGNMTNEIIESLINYCHEFGTVSYYEVMICCREALNKYIFLWSGKKETPISDCRELTDRFMFFVDQTAKRLDILPEIIEPRSLAYFENNRDPNPVNFLYYTYLLFPNLDSLHFAENMNNIRTSVNVLMDRLSGVKHSSLQSMLFLYSTEGGVGKSVFQNIIYEWAKAKGIKITYTRVPHNQFIGDEFNKNGICLFSDITRDECVNWNKINDLIDGTNYIVEQKGIDRYELKSQSFLIGSSNFHPKDENNRRIAHSFVQFGSTKLEPLSKHKVFALKKGSVDLNYYIPIVDKWILSCPDNGFDFSSFYTGLSSSAEDWFSGLEDDFAFVLRAIGTYFSYNSLDYIREQEVSVSTLKNRLNKSVKKEEIKEIEPTYEFSRKQVNHVMTFLYKKGKIALETNSKDTYQKSYSVAPLIQYAEEIAREHTENPYTKDFFERPDYIQERIVVVGVMKQILSKHPEYETQEIKDFINTPIQ